MKVDMEFLTPAEVAKITRLSPRTLERWRGDGTGPPFVKVGSGLRARVLYRREDVYIWLNRVYMATSEYTEGSREHTEQ